jgi:hypothetical protein
MCAKTIFEYRRSNILSASCNDKFLLTSCDVEEAIFVETTEVT